MFLDPIFKFFFGKKKHTPTTNEETEFPLGEKLTSFLIETVSFYRSLSPKDRRSFDEQALLFIQSTDIAGQGITVIDEDCLLIAASAIIPVWNFPGWHYFNLQKVILLPDRFNNQLEIGKENSTILGMVGSGSLQGKMILSKPHLHHGFKNSHDRKNVGIHEFAHLIDMADGKCDGVPSKLGDFIIAEHWLQFVRQQISEIMKGASDIDEYGATADEEFFAVATEYFFERPKLLKTRHPKLYDALEQFYRQNLADIETTLAPKRNSPCPCGSKKKYKHCCAKTLSSK